MQEMIGPMVGIAGLLLSCAGLVFTLGSLNRRIGEHGERLDKHDSRFDRLEKSQRDDREILIRLEEKIDGLLKRAAPRRRSADA